MFQLVRTNDIIVCESCGKVQCPLTNFCLRFRDTVRVDNREGKVLHYIVEVRDTRRTRVIADAPYCTCMIEYLLSSTLPRFPVTSSRQPADLVLGIATSDSSPNTVSYNSSKLSPTRRLKPNSACLKKTAPHLMNTDYPVP